MESKKEEIGHAVARGFGKIRPDSLGAEATVATIEAVVDAVMQLPPFTELNIERELVRLYDNCKDDRLKFDLLLQIHCMKNTITEMKKGQ